MWHANIKTGHQTSFLSPSQWVFYFVTFALGNQLKHLNNRKLAAQWGKMEIISQTAVTKWFQAGIVLHKWINLWRVSGSKHLQHGLWGKKALFSCVCLKRKRSWSTIHVFQNYIQYCFRNARKSVSFAEATESCWCKYQTVHVYEHL